MGDCFGHWGTVGREAGRWVKPGPLGDTVLLASDVESRAYLWLLVQFKVKFKPCTMSRLKVCDAVVVSAFIMGSHQFSGF